jgi:hypothetical protein
LRDTHGDETYRNSTEAEMSRHIALPIRLFERFATGNIPLGEIALVVNFDHVTQLDLLTLAGLQGFFQNLGSHHHWATVGAHDDHLALRLLPSSKQVAK